VASPQKRTRLQRLRNASNPAGSPERHRSTDSWDSQSSTPTKAPHHETRLTPDNLHMSEAQGRLERKLSLVKAGIEFGRRLYHDEDETLVGHCEATDGRKLRPAMSFSSGTSTALTSPMSDTFSPVSTSCSVSTSSSRLSPHHEEKFDLGYDEFPTEVGGMASLDLEEPGFRGEAAEVFVSLVEPDVDYPSLAVPTNPPAIDSQPSFKLSAHFQPTLNQETEAPLSKALSPTVLGASSIGRGEIIPSMDVPSNPSLKLSAYNHNSSLSSTGPSSPVENRRRAFSGASERLREFREELIAQSTTGNASAGRLRSCSVSASGDGNSSNGLIEQAARSRSRSNSASGSVPHEMGGGRTLSAMPSKESFRTKFANMPGYATFLREITLEIWIDQVRKGVSIRCSPRC
jgi:hypothetical protein